MKKGLSLRTAAILVALLAFLGTAINQTANAQTQVCNPPVDFYRFIVNNSELGTLLTTNYQEGVNLNFAYYPFPNGYGKIAVPPGPGYTPVAGQGLMPLYRYKIVQNGRIYYGYFNAPASGSGYYFEGISGYVLPGYGQYGGIALQAYYSQTKGYFYTADSETPIGYPYYYGFAYHGSPAYMPQGSSYCWNPPPPSCDPDGSQEQACYDNGGTWNPSNCHCSFINPCRSGEEPVRGKKNKDGVERPPLPCRQAN
ncbi:MAG TPA: hypothetical protein VGC91_14485 [Pyrinomonadaceae bacterium]|jgi:hypothetical protein